MAFLGIFVLHELSNAAEQRAESEDDEED